jgi:two-component SAPR family response regulator
MQTISDVRQEAINIIKKHIAIFDDKALKTIIHLDDDQNYLDIIKQKCKNQDNVITISNTDDFKAFIDTSGGAKIYIDIHMGTTNGIDFAEELHLSENFSELIFVSSHEPTDEDLARISAMGGKFMSKTRLLTII